MVFSMETIPVISYKTVVATVKLKGMTLFYLIQGCGTTFWDTLATSFLSGIFF